MSRNLLAVFGTYRMKSVSFLSTKGRLDQPEEVIKEIFGSESKVPT